MAAVYVKIGTSTYNLDKAYKIENRESKIWIHFSHRIEKIALADSAEYFAELESVLGAIADTPWITFEGILVNTDECLAIVKKDSDTLNIYTYENKISIEYANITSRDSAYDALETFVSGISGSLWRETTTGNKVFNSAKLAKTEPTGDADIDFALSDNIIINETYADASTRDTDLANFEGDQIATQPLTGFLTVEEGLTELNLDGAVLSVAIYGDAFADSTLTGGNFTLNNAPSGTTVDSVAHIDSTHCEITLAFDDTDFDVDVTDFSVTIAAAELDGAVDIDTNEITIVSVVE